MLCAKGGVEKEKAAGRDGDEGELRADFQSIWSSHQVGVRVQIPGEDLDSDRRRLAGGGQESQEGNAKLGKAGQGYKQGGRRPQGVTEILNCRDTGCLALWVGNMGTDGEDGKGPGQFSVQSRAEAHGEVAAAREGRDLVLPFFGGSNEGGKDC